MQTPPITSPYAPDVEKLRAWLEQQIARLSFVTLVTAVVSLITRMAQINGELQKNLSHLQRARPRSETLARVERQLLFAFGVKVATQKNDKAKTSRAGKHPGRTRQPARLERVYTPNPVPADARICPLCGAEMKTVSHSACETLSIIPAKIIVAVRLDETVACPYDDSIASASPPAQIVERGALSDTLIVEALCDKYIEHQPIERQCTRFARAGAELSPQTLGRSVAAAIDLLAPIAARIDEQTRAPGHLGTDATSLRILDPAAHEGIRSGAMWCWTNARWVSFFYSPSADSDSVRRFLGAASLSRRVVQCDGTSTLTFLEREGATRPGCWSHARRGFALCARAGDSLALEGLKLIAPLFAVERESLRAADSADDRRDRRREKSAPVLRELRAWLDLQRELIPPKTGLGKALGYLHRQWPRLILFVDDGHIELTNNRRERELRRLVVGRKNWLFAWLDLGGERTAKILSILASCIAHDVNPRAYLHLVTKRIVHGWPHAKLRDLLPDRMLASHPELYVGESSALTSPSLHAPALAG